MIRRLPSLNPVWSRKSLLLAVALLLAGSLALFGQQTPDGYVVWRSVDGASAYDVEIRNSAGAVVMQKRVNENRVHVMELPFGDYTVRVGPVGTDGRRLVWSRWRPLRIVQVRTPVVEGNQTEVVRSQDGGNQSFTIRGANFVQATRARIHNESDEIPVVSTRANENGDRLTIEADMDNAEAGTYDLTVENPLDRRIVRRGYVVVREAREGEGQAGENVGVPDDGRAFHEYSLAEYRAYVTSLSRDCKQGGPPSVIVESCRDYFVTLNLSNRDRWDLYFFMKADGRNYFDRQRGYEYFAEKCSPVFRPTKELLELVLRPGSSAGPTEKSTAQKALDRMQNCPSN